ncbi:hypothetical protein [Actinoplanes sp. NPDC051494]|uniref:hypothetical protein n=1 Tax=Actinoplanes sp. NPDC051494 TaxID=3363907 RepID=UPI0037890E5C
MPPSRIAASLLSTTVLGSALLATAMPAQAAGVATATPLRFSLGTSETATDVLAVGSDVWVAAGNGVVIASNAGKVRKTVAGVLGARGLTPSPDGKSVFVSSSTSAKIVQVSAAGAIMGSWASQPCPGKSAVAGGALYYAYGCSASAHGVARFDLTSHASTSVLTDFAAEAVTGARSTLVVYASSGMLTSYAVGADGSLTENASVSNTTTYDAEISPDGSQLITTKYGGGYGLARYDTATMTPGGTFTTGPYPTAVAWSPDGGRFAGILDAMYTDRAVHVFSASTGSAVMRSTSAGNTSYRSSANEASWSADGRYFYSVVQESGKTAYLLVTPTAGQATAAMTASVTAPTAYGKNLMVTVRVPKRPRTAVKVSVTQNGATESKTVTTDASGVAKAWFAGRANGTVAVSAGADLTFLAGSASARFSTPSALTVKALEATKVSGGVAHYPSLAAVRIDFQALPKSSAKLSIKLQHLSGKKWKTDQAGTITTLSDGWTSLSLKQGTRKTTYRIVAKVTSSPSGGASPQVNSPRFVVD